MLHPDLSRLSLGTVPTDAGEQDRVLAVADLVRRILLSIDAGDTEEAKREACQAAASWCATNPITRLACDDDATWTALTRAVFPNARAPNPDQKAFAWGHKRFLKGWFEGYATEGQRSTSTSRKDHIQTWWDSNLGPWPTVRRAKEPTAPKAWFYFLCDQLKHYREIQPLYSNMRTRILQRIRDTQIARDSFEYGTPWWNYYMYEMGKIGNEYESWNVYAKVAQRYLKSLGLPAADFTHKWYNFPTPVGLAPLPTS